MANEIHQALQPPDLQEIRGCFTNTVITTPRLCTAMDSSPCHIAAQISVCNELLNNVQLQLQEYCPRHLHLASLEIRRPNSESGDEIDQAFSLVSCLLKYHRCIISLDIRPWNFFHQYEKMVSSSYRPTAELKILRLVGDCWVPRGKELLIKAVAPRLPFLTGLEEFHCALSWNPHNLIEPLCCLLKKTSALKKLSLAHFNPTLREASLFWSVLSKNSTLTHLSINSRFIMPQSASSPLSFAGSLAKNTALKSLAISSHERFRAIDLRYIIVAAGRSKSIVDLSLSYFVINSEAFVAIEELLTGKCCLRKFSLKDCRWYREPGEAVHFYYTPDVVDVLSDRIRPWINILQKNRSLEELRLNFVTFSHADCQAFFTTLQNSTSLKRVVVEDLKSIFYYRGKLARSGSAQSKVDDPPLDMPDVIISQCKQLRNIDLLLMDKKDISWFELVVLALRSCTHVSELAISTRAVGIEHDVEVLIADCIKNTTTLKALRLCLCAHPYDVVKCAPCRIQIIEALKGNSSLRKLSLQNYAFIEDEAALLAAMLRSSNNIYDLEILTSKKSIEALVNHLHPEFTKNYKLISLRFLDDDYLGPGIPLTMEYYYVRNIVRRNCDFITRAINCSTGDRSRRCAEAFELVADNPVLVEKVGELQSVGEKEASQLIRQTLSALLGLDDFMRITGVVKRCVSCTNSTDHKLQLEDIDGYSWLHVRRLLRISDVLPHSSST